MIKKSSIVMAFGAFDGIHTGHIYYLKEAKKLGERLIVVTARDNAEWKFKRAYSLPEEERAALVKTLNIADEVILGSTTDALEKVKDIDPDILVVTPYNPIDKDLLQKELEKHNLQGRVVQLKPYKPKIYDSVFKSERTYGKTELMGLPPQRNNQSMSVAKELPFEEEIRRKLGSGQKRVVLLETTSENVLKINAAMTKILVQKGQVVVVSTTRAYTDLVGVYQKNNLTKEKILVIDFTNDFVHNKSGKKNFDDGNHICIKNISDLTSLTIALEEAMRPDTTILIDSLPTLLGYNKPELVSRFIHSLFTKIRENRGGIVVVSLETGMNAEVRAETAQLCDTVIKI